MEVLIWPCINYFFHGVLIYTRRDDKEILARVTWDGVGIHFLHYPQPCFSHIGN